MPLKQRDILLIEITWQGVGRRRQIEQTATLCFIDPFLCVAISVEDDALVLFIGRLYDLADRCAQIYAARLELIGETAQHICHRRVEVDVAAGDGL